MKAINAGNRQEGLFCQLHDLDLNKHIMKLANEFYRSNPNARSNPKLAPSYQGKQRGTEIWVLSDSCQINEDGNLLNPEDSVYKWMGNFIPNNILEKSKSTIELPLRAESFEKTLEHLKQAVPGNNFIASFVFIASGVMGMHYKRVQEIFCQCPTPIAMGDNDTGKTTSAKAFLSVVGRRENGLARQLSSAEAASKCSSSTIPFVFDDPDNLNDVKTMIKNTFNGQVQSNTRTTTIPRTICMVTINEEKVNTLLENFRESSRVVLVPFPKVEKPHSEEFRFEYQQNLQKANKHASRSIGQFIQLAKSLKGDNWQEEFKSDVISFARKCVGENVNGRVLQNYAILLHFVLQLAKTYPNHSPSMLEIEDYFKTYVLPVCEHVQRRHYALNGAKDKVTYLTDYEDVLNTFVGEMVSKLKCKPISELLEILNPCVQSQVLNGTHCYAIRKTEGFKYLNKAGIQKPTMKSLEGIVRKNNLGEQSVGKNFKNANNDEQQIKNSNSTKQRAIIFKRSIIEKNLRKEFDNLLGYVTPPMEADEENGNENELSIICSTDNKWLICNHELAALGSVENDMFKISTVLRRDIIGAAKSVKLDEERTYCIFPDGMKIKVKTENEVQHNEDNGAEHEGSDHANDTLRSRTVSESTEYSTSVQHDEIIDNSDVDEGEDSDFSELQLPAMNKILGDKLGGCSQSGYHSGDNLVSASDDEDKDLSGNPINVNVNKQERERKMKRRYEKEPIIRGQWRKRNEREKLIDNLTVPVHGKRVKKN